MFTTDATDEIMEFGIDDEGILINHIGGSDIVARKTLEEFLTRLEALGISGNIVFSSPCG